MLYNPVFNPVADWAQRWRVPPGSPMLNPEDDSLAALSAALEREGLSMRRPPPAMANQRNLADAPPRQPPPEMLADMDLAGNRQTWGPQLHSAQPDSSAAAAEFYTSLPMMLAPMGPAFNAAGRGIGAVMQGMRAAPRTSAAGIAGLTTLGTQGETQQPPQGHVEMEGANRRLGEIGTAEQELRDEQKTIRDNARRFSSVNSQSDPETIKALQRFLNGQGLYNFEIDGNWGNPRTSRTQQAFNTWQERRAARERQIGEQLTLLGTQRTEQQGIVNRLERDELVRSIDRDMPTWARWVQDYGPLAGLGTGAALSVGLRQMARRGTERVRERLVAEGNQALGRAAPDEAGRAGALNTFYARGSGPAPFDVNPNAPLGFSASPNQMVDASGLYPVGRAWMRGGDIGRMGVMGGGFGLAWDRREAAQRELTEARQVVEEVSRRNQVPTRDQMERVRRAQTNYATADLAFQTARGALLYPGTSAVMRYRNTATPNTDLAESEVIRLNRLLADQGSRQPWSRPTVTEIPPLRRVDTPNGQRMQRPSGHWASREEIDLEEAHRNLYPRSQRHR